MEKITNVKVNYIYSTIYHIILILYPLITTPYLARILGAQGIGAYTLVHTVASYFLQLSLLGMETYGNRQTAYLRDKQEAMEKAFSEMYVVQLFFCTVSLVLYGVCAKCFWFGPETLVLIHFIFIGSSFFDVSWFFYGIERIDFCIKVNLIIKLITIIAIFGFIKSIDDLEIYTVIMCAGQFVTSFILWKSCCSFVKLQRVEWKNVKKRILPVVILFLPVIASSVYKSMDKIMLGLMLESEEAVGLYNNSEQLLGVPQGLVVALGIVMLPRVSNMVSRGTHEQIKEELRECMRITNFLAIGVTFGVASIAEEFVPLFLGDGFVKCVEYVIWLAPSNLFICWGYTIRNQYLIPYKKDNVFVGSIVLGAIINFLANLILINEFRIMGVIIGTLLSEGLVAFVQTFSVRKKLDIACYVCDALPFFVSAVIMGGVVRFIGNCFGGSIYTVLLEITFGGIVYVALAGIYFFFFHKDSFSRFKKLL